MRFVRQTKKKPDAAFFGDIAALGRGFCAEVGHFPSTGIAAKGGQGKEKLQAFLPDPAFNDYQWRSLTPSSDPECHHSQRGLEGRSLG